MLTHADMAVGDRMLLARLEAVQERLTPTTAAAGTISNDVLARSWSTAMTRRTSGSR